MTNHIFSPKNIWNEINIVKLYRIYMKNLVLKSESYLRFTFLSNNKFN